MKEERTTAVPPAAPIRAKRDAGAGRAPGAAAPPRAGEWRSSSAGAPRAVGGTLSPGSCRGSSLCLQALPREGWETLAWESEVLGSARLVQQKL